MASRTPLVTTKIDGFQTLGQNEVTALMVPPKNAQSIAEALERALEDRGLAERLAAAAQLRAREFGWDRIAEQLLDFYRQAGATNGLRLKTLPEAQPA